MNRLKSIAKKIKCHVHNCCNFIYYLYSNGYPIFMKIKNRYKVILIKRYTPKTLLYL